MCKKGWSPVGTFTWEFSYIKAMAAINDLIAQIESPELRSRIEVEMNRLLKQKKFGLVFEDHIPEACCLPEVPVRVGSRVAKKTSKPSEQMIVQNIQEGTATCFRIEDKSTEQICIDDLVCVATFGEPIYPYLEMLDKVEGAPDKELWHTLIEADNYHALQLLCYLYAGMVDCIYIDPPYNTGARDWKYNNDYVDSSDQYRHSKWLSMIKRRLELAKILLNPKDSVLIVTIDEKEYHHLACLLEELYPDASIQMVTNVINPKGNRRDNQFSRCEEYIFLLYFGESSICSNGTDMLRSEKTDEKEENKSIRMKALLRSAGNHGRRTDRPNLFYPLLFEKESGKYLGHGPVLTKDESRLNYCPPDNCVAMWPIGADGTELTWNLQPDTLTKKWEKHFIRFGKWDGRQRVAYYLTSGQEEDFENGLYNIIGVDADGGYILELKDASVKEVRPLSVWSKTSHSASDYGTTLLNKIIGSGRFSFPKSLYAVHDTIRFFVANKPNALIVDFFAGSGTTLHAVNLLNAEDSGNRRCIMVTNNEVSEAEAKDLTKKGFKPGDEEWEKLGIARYVNWPRTVCSIEGHDVNGQPLKGNYLGSDIPMADGFKANAAFFRLGFLDKTSVALGQQFRQMIPLLWMKAGAVGDCPILEDGDIPPMLIFASNHFAVLTEEYAFCEFEQKIAELGGIDTVYIVTDSEATYREMISHINCRQSFQLYRDYLDNFRINKAR